MAQFSKFKMLFDLKTNFQIDVKIWLFHSFVNNIEASKNMLVIYKIIIMFKNFEQMQSKTSGWEGGLGGQKSRFKHCLQ